MPSSTSVRDLSLFVRDCENGDRAAGLDRRDDFRIGRVSAGIVAIVFGEQFVETNVALTLNLYAYESVYETTGNFTQPYGNL